MELHKDLSQGGNMQYVKQTGERVWSELRELVIEAEG